MKGFVFTLDALLATTIAIVILIATYTMIPKGQQDYFLDDYKTKIANDILIVLDKSNTLETNDETLIQNSLTSILPNNYGARLNVYVYECATHDCDNFVLSSKVAPYVITVNRSMPEKDSVLAKRSFLSFENNRIKYYSLAELRVWLV